MFSPYYIYPYYPKKVYKDKDNNNKQASIAQTVRANGC